MNNIYETTWTGSSWTSGQVIFSGFSAFGLGLFPIGGYEALFASKLIGSWNIYRAIGDIGIKSSSLGEIKATFR